MSEHNVEVGEPFINIHYFFYSTHPFINIKIKIGSTFLYPQIRSTFLLYKKSNPSFSPFCTNITLQFLHTGYRLQVTGYRLTGYSKISSKMNHPIFHSFSLFILLTSLCSISCSQPLHFYNLHHHRHNHHHHHNRHNIHNIHHNNFYHPFTLPPSISPEFYQTSDPSYPPEPSPIPEPYQPPLPSPSTPSSSPLPSPSTSPSPSPSPLPPPPPPPPTESLSVTPPLATDNLPVPPPECTLSLLSYSFGDTMGRPPVSVPYSPPSDCLPPWSAAVLHLSGAVSGEQYDRIAAVWLAGAEILRTSTPEPSKNGTVWNVHKDVTRYMSLLQKSNLSLTMMLENVVNDVFTGVIDVNLTISFYKDNGGGVVEGNLNRKLSGLGLGFKGFGGVEVEGYDEPADLVIPVNEGGNYGSWFRIEAGLQAGSKSIVVPMNAKRIVLEVYVSSHGDDEFWYSNPPTRYIELNNLPTKRGNGAFREVFARIDGNVVGSEVPFPVVFTGGINPLFWEPVVAIGAFDLPTYEFDLTPFLGSVLDGQSHSFEIGVTNAIQFWLVDANLHVWLDKGSAKIEAQMGIDKPPKMEESYEYEFKQLDGEFEIEVERESVVTGWVATSCGNFTTSIEKKMKFENKIEYKNGGTYKTVKQKVKVKTEVKVVSETGSEVYKRKFKRKYPLKLITSTVPGPEADTDLITTNLTHSLDEKLSYGKHSSSVQNTQESGGWILVKGHSVLNGSAETWQNLSYQGDSGCYFRNVKAADGRLIFDEITAVCLSLFRKVLNVFFGVW